MRRTTKLLIGMLSLGLIFLAALGAEIYMVNSLLKARESVNWPITKGLILHSELKISSGLNTTFEALIKYKYQVAGQTYQSSRIRARGTSSRNHNEVAEIVAQLPVGREVAVYHNPSNPSDALLIVGADETDYLIAIIPNIFVVFFTVMLVFAFRVWRKAMRGVDITQEEDFSQEPPGYRTWGPRVKVHCFSCKKEVEARTFRLFDKTAIPPQTSICVECLPCGVTWLVKLPLEELGRYSADELTPQLYFRVSMIVKFLALGSVALCWFPFVGLIMGAMGYLASYHLGGWTKRYSLIGLMLSAVVTVCFVGLLIFVK